MEESAKVASSDDEYDTDIEIEGRRDHFWMFFEENKNLKQIILLKEMFSKSNIRELCWANFRRMAPCLTFRKNNCNPTLDLSNVSLKKWINFQQINNVFTEEKI